MRKAGSGVNNSNQMMNKYLKMQKNAVRCYTVIRGAIVVLGETEVKSHECERWLLS